MVYDADEFAEMEDVDISRVAQETIFEASIRTQNKWREILDKAGWRNTGEGISSITLEPQSEGATEYRIGSNKVQVRIAEYGRRPGAAMPPHEPLADWVHEQAGLPSKGDEGFDNTVFNIRSSIAEEGIPAIGAGREAFRQVNRDIGGEIEKQLDDEMGE